MATEEISETKASSSLLATLREKFALRAMWEQLTWTWKPETKR